MSSEAISKPSGGQPPEALHQQLFSITEQLNPALRGCISPPETFVISGHQTPLTSLQALHTYWQTHFPEAGRSYWSVRSWELLIWQPVLIAVTAVYGLSAIPPLQQLTQRLDKGIVAGYSLPAGCWFRGSHAQLIVRAGRELNTLVTSLLEQLQQVCTLRPRLARALFSDQLVSALARVPAVSGLISEVDIRAQLPLWLEATELPPRGMQTDANLHIARLSCCMHYRRHDGELCTNCPRPTPLSAA